MLDSVRQNDSTATRVTWIAHCTARDSRALAAIATCRKNYALHAMMQRRLAPQCKLCDLRATAILYNAL